MPTPRPSEASRLAIRAGRESLAAFTWLHWNEINPGVPLVWGRHLDAICEHLEAITRREARTFVGNVPPGHTKSTILDQMWGPWEWLEHPERRWIFATNSLANARKESTYRRQILLSDTYQALGPSFTLGRAGKQVMCVRNSQNGSFRAVSVGTKVLGDHADTLVIDDPHDALCISGEDLAAVRTWHDEALSTRVRDGHAKALIMQRLAEGDLSDHLVTRGVDIHLCLPAIYAERTDPGPTCLGWRDWRVPGELLYPQRFGQAWIDEKRRDLGRVGFAAQILQDPIAGEGNLFDRAWWLRHDDLPSAILAWVATVDTAAATHEDADRTAIQIWALGADGIAYLAEGVSGRWEMVEALQQAEGLAKRWPACRKWLVERRGNGFAFHELATARLRGRSVVAWKSQDPKEARIRGCSPHIEAGLVSLPRTPEAESLIEEAARFPRGTHDDRVDAMAIALREWTGRMMRRPSQAQGICAPAAAVASRPRPASGFRLSF